MNEEVVDELEVTRQRALDAALRDVQALVVSSDPPAEVLASVTERLEEVAELLRPWPTDAWMSPSESWIGSTARIGPRTLTPPFVVDRRTDDAISGRVTFSRFYLGGAGAAHGGAIPLLFDSLMGSLLNTPAQGQTRTASLTVNFRKITPIGPELTFDVSIDRVEGRKVFVTGRLRNGDELVADAEGLFVKLRPGQP